MAFGKLEDLSGSVELVIFPDAYARVEPMLKQEKPVVVSGFLEVEEGVAKVMVNEISLMEDLLRKTKSLTFRLEKLKPDEFQSLHSILLEFQGQTQIKLSMFLTDFQKSIELDCEDIKGVQMSNEFFENLQSTLGRTDFVEVGI